MELKRVFIAADIASEVREKLAALAGEFQGLSAKINFTIPENMHITLQFLGDTPDEILSGLCRTIETAVKGFGQLEFEVQNIRRIPPQRMPRMLWAEVGQGAEKLAKLAAKISTATEPLGFAPEKREFLPHATICRVKKISLQEEKKFDEILKQLQGQSFGTTLLEEVTVYQSILRSHRPEYIPLKKCKL